MSEPVNNLLRGLAPDQRRRITNALMADQYNRPTPQDGPVVERAGMFPLGTYANGQTGIAWPGFVAQPVESFVNLLRRGYQGGTGDTQGVQDAFNVAGGALVGGIASPKPANALGIFGGRLAKTADQAALARAEDMAARGVPREQIWTDTGWFRGVDGKWRFEIDDSGAMISGRVADEFARRPFGDRVPVQNADRFMDHPVLHSAYPDLWRVNTALNKADDLPHGNYFVRESGAEGVDLTAKTLPQARSLALHEYQHAIQQREPFALGADASQGMRSYANSAGEVEARAVQRRMDMTPEQRRARFPWLDYDVPEADQIVRFSR